MTQVAKLPAPDLGAQGAPAGKWEREREAFFRMLPEMLSSHRGKFVAIHEGQVVEVGDELIPVALKAFEKFGYQEIYVGLVSCDPLPLTHIPRYRELSNIRR